MEAARSAAERLYGDGVMDGMEIALRLALGQHAEGGEPFEGETLEEFQAWARRALDRIEADKLR